MIEEQKRLAALHDLEILSGPREPALDQIAKMAQTEFNAQHAGIMMVDSTTADFVARANIKIKSIPRQQAFCNVAIQRSVPLIIPDTRLDPRFSGFPHVSLGVRSYAGIPLRTRSGYNIGSLCVFGSEPMDFAPEKIRKLQDLAKLAMHCIELRQLAIQDHLTGCLNRRGFMMEFERQLPRLDRDMGALSLAVLDIDHFKQVNDQFGHPVGDLVLQAVVALAAEHVSSTDLYGRLGGEEFGILLPGLDGAAAFAVVERLRHAIELMRLPSEPTLRVTASFGIAEASPAVAQSSALMALADAALYSAKVNGRNRTEMAEGQAGDVVQAKPVQSVTGSVA